MKTTLLPDKTEFSKKIEAFSVTQAVVGVELDQSDDDLLAYFHFFASKIPVSAAFFVHVVPSPEIFNIDEMNENDLSFALGEEMSEGIIREMERRVENIFKKTTKAYIEYDVRSGDPLEEILSDTEELKADLVVIGQKKKKGWHSILARNLARKTKGNALIIPSEAKKIIQNILVPVDFSPNSIRALQTALAICKQVEQPARVTCLHAYEMPNFNYYRIGKTMDQMEALIKKNLNEAMNAFIHTYAGEDEHYVKKVLLNRERPGIAAYITDFARQNGADFLVMGAKGHSKVALLLMGSVTESVLDSNPEIPVLVVK